MPLKNRQRQANKGASIIENGRVFSAEDPIGTLVQKYSVVKDQSAGAAAVAFGLLRLMQCVCVSAVFNSSHKE